MRYLGLGIAAALSVAVVAVAAAADGDPQPSSGDAEQTVARIVKSVNERDGAALCRDVLALRTEHDCAARIGKLLTDADRHATLRSIHVSQADPFLRVDAQIDLVGDRKPLGTTMWLTAGDPQTIIRPGSFLLRATGRPHEAADADARPLRDTDLTRRPAGTGTVSACRAATVAAAKDPAGDVEAIGKLPPASHQARFDIRSVRLAFSHAGQACVKVGFARAVRSGTLLTLNLDQDRSTFNTFRSLETTSVLLAPSLYTAVADQPTGVVVGLRGKSVEIGLRPGAINRREPWSLDIEAVAEDLGEPLVTHPESAGDTAVLRSPNSAQRRRASQAAAPAR
jgi:hypothetical protein